MITQSIVFLLIITKSYCTHYILDVPYLTDSWDWYLVYLWIVTPIVVIASFKMNRQDLSQLMESRKKMGNLGKFFKGVTPIEFLLILIIIQDGTAATLFAVANFSSHMIFLKAEEVYNGF